MTKRELLELIRATIKEYTGTGASGGNAGDGNSITSPRPFVDEEDELKNYTKKGAPYGGADGGHYKKEPSNKVYPNRDPRGGMFETK